MGGPAKPGAFALCGTWQLAASRWAGGQTPASLGRMTSDFLLGGDLPVNRMGFGAMRLGAWGGPGRTPETGMAVLRRAVELGVNHIDTAAFYPRANDLI